MKGNRNAVAPLQELWRLVEQGRVPLLCVRQLVRQALLRDDNGR